MNEPAQQAYFIICDDKGDPTSYWEFSGTRTHPFQLETKTDFEEYNLDIYNKYEEMDQYFKITGKAEVSSTPPAGLITIADRNLQVLLAHSTKQRDKFVNVLTEIVSLLRKQHPHCTECQVTTDETIRIAKDALNEREA